MVGVQCIVLAIMFQNAWCSLYPDYDYDIYLKPLLELRSNAKKKTNAPDKTKTNARDKTKTNAPDKTKTNAPIKTKLSQNKTQRKTKTTKRVQDFSKMFFPSLENYVWQATKVSEVKYPWIARVIHSSTQQTPHVCTAACIDRQVFITAARCIHSLKVRITTINYQYTSLTVKAFVLPSKPSKQYFDDIGFIVTNAEPLPSTDKTGDWPTIKLYTGKRTDQQFQWFADLDTVDVPLYKMEGQKNITAKPVHKVVGYATTKHLHRLKTPTTEYHLSELDVMIGAKMCSEIYTLKKSNHFFVPCYVSCPFQQFPNGSATCKRYHGVEGAAIIDVNKDQLFGIATWGVSFAKYDLPVGFSVPNSDNFHMDYKCAKKIRDTENELSFVGFYKNLCEEYS